MEKTVERISELEKKTTKKQCVHHWVIDDLNVGRCKKCPAVKDFDALMNKDKNVAEILHLAPKGGGKRGRKRKQVG